ncbi:MAG: glutamine--tRNA ligase/YqeY domain fusion protein [Gammaproteobacteria bacterium]|nr:glutamine--tRNA ligase/YqeY domain fusion protein [Gammaproteobacteria bacterium]
MKNEDLRDFIRNRIREDLAADRVPVRVTTRFPPEPNGYLHIGHAKSICLNFGIAQEFDGITYLRFDDTNPLTESPEYVSAIQEDIRWLGFDWQDNLTFASDYFPQLYAFAEELIGRGKAFVCDLSPDEIRDTRGSFSNPGTESPFRNRSIAENMELFRRMRKGEFEDGERVLRAKIDMRSPNINMRDPVLYRIVHADHHRTGSEWCIYPMYDFTHCICDALEGITHSLCTLEFEDHRPLYDWVLDNININFHPPQIEFSRLNLEYTLMSKRVLNKLVQGNYVDGWNDPRMPTLAGLRRRGIPAAAIREFCRRIGVTKQDNFIETELLDYCVRSELEDTTPRGMALREPLRVEITNFEQEEIQLSAEWHSKNKELGKRNLSFGSTIFIDRSDFAEQPPPKFRRLVPGGIVRLRYAYIIQCDEVIRGRDGKVESLRASYFPNSKSGEDTSGIRPKGVIQFVSAQNSVNVQIRDYERLFDTRNPGKNELESELNTESRIAYQGMVEQAVVDHRAARFQFERIGYYVRDRDCKDEVPVYHRTAKLSEGWKPK